MNGVDFGHASRPPCAAQQSNPRACTLTKAINQKHTNDMIRHNKRQQHQQHHQQATTAAQQRLAYRRNITRGAVTTQHHRQQWRPRAERCLGPPRRQLRAGARRDTTRHACMHCHRGYRTVRRAEQSGRTLRGCRDTAVVASTGRAVAHDGRGGGARKYAGVQGTARRVLQ